MRPRTKTRVRHAIVSSPRPLDSHRTLVFYDQRDDIVRKHVPMIRTQKGAVSSNDRSENSTNCRPPLRRTSPSCDAAFCATRRRSFVIVVHEGFCFRTLSRVSRNSMKSIFERDGEARLEGERRGIYTKGLQNHTRDTS